MRHAGRNERLFFSACHNVDAGYDNSAAFDAYLKGQGLDAILEDTGLKLHTQRRIVPHVRIASLVARCCQNDHLVLQRLGVPLDASPSDTPVFQGEESWYRAVCT